MSTQIEVRLSGRRALVTVRGVVDRTIRDVAAGSVRVVEGCSSVVVDLRDAVLVSRHGIEDLVAAIRDRAGTARLAVVCDRLAGRRLLRLVCRTTGVRVLREVPADEGAAGPGTAAAERRSAPAVPVDVRTGPRRGYAPRVRAAGPMGTVGAQPAG